MNEAMKPDVRLTLFEFLPYCKASVTLYVSLGFTWPDYLFGPDFLRGNPGHFLLCELLPGKYVHFFFHLCSGQHKISWSKIPSSHLEKWKSEETASRISQRHDRNAFKENITYLFFPFWWIAVYDWTNSAWQSSAPAAAFRGFTVKTKLTVGFGSVATGTSASSQNQNQMMVLDVSIVSYDYLQPLSKKSRAAGGLLTECMFILKCVSSQKAVMMLSIWMTSRTLSLATEQMISYQPGCAQFSVGVVRHIILSVESLWIMLCIYFFHFVLCFEENSIFMTGNCCH